MPSPELTAEVTLRHATKLVELSMDTSSLLVVIDRAGSAWKMGGVKAVFERPRPPRIKAAPARSLNRFQRLEAKHFRWGDGGRWLCFRDDQAPSAIILLPHVQFP
jgi:hypothetical protein